MTRSQDPDAGESADTLLEANSASAAPTATAGEAWRGARGGQLDSVVSGQPDMRA
jgi:hypothetical protein